MRRGDVVTVAAGSGFGGKPRPAVVIQSDQFETVPTVTLCLFTTDRTDVPVIRVAVEPNASNGLRERCSLMVDKLIAVPRQKVGRHVGHLSPLEMANLDRALLVFLGLAG